jgi:hypothetical protein
LQNRSVLGSQLVDFNNIEESQNCYILGSRPIDLNNNIEQSGQKSLDESETERLKFSLEKSLEVKMTEAQERQRIAYGLPPQSRCAKKQSSCINLKV